MALHYTQWGYFVKKRRPAGRLAYPWSGQVLEVAVSANLPSSSAGRDPHLTLQCSYMQHLVVHFTQTVTSRTTYPPLVYHLPSLHHQDQQGDPQRLGYLRHLRSWLSWPGQSDPLCLSFETWQLRLCNFYPALSITSKTLSKHMFKEFLSRIWFQNWRNLCRHTRAKRIAAYSKSGLRQLLVPREYIFLRNRAS